jgi:hypothetical protein
MTCKDCAKYDTCPAHPEGRAYGVAEALDCFTLNVAGKEAKR